MRFKLSGSNIFAQNKGPNKTGLLALLQPLLATLSKCASSGPWKLLSPKWRRPKRIGPGQPVACQEAR